MPCALNSSRLGQPLPLPWPPARRHTKKTAKPAIKLKAAARSRTRSKLVVSAVMCGPLPRTSSIRWQRSPALTEPSGRLESSVSSSGTTSDSCVRRIRITARAPPGPRTALMRRKPCQLAAPGGRPSPVNPSYDTGKELVTRPRPRRFRRPNAESRFVMCQQSRLLMPCRGRMNFPPGERDVKHCRTAGPGRFAQATRRGFCPRASIVGRSTIESETLPSAPTCSW